jgi:hypothetical protein
VSGSFTESDVEQAALAWSEGVGWQVRDGAEIAPAGPIEAPVFMPVAEAEGRCLRGVFLADEETVHNAFSDRRFAP